MGNLPAIRRSTTLRFLDSLHRGPTPLAGVGRESGRTACVSRPVFPSIFRIFLLRIESRCPMPAQKRVLGVRCRSLITRAGLFPKMPAHNRSFVDKLHRQAIAVRQPCPQHSSGLAHDPRGALASARAEPVLNVGIFSLADVLLLAFWLGWPPALPLNGPRARLGHLAIPMFNLSACHKLSRLGRLPGWACPFAACDREVVAA